MMSQKIKDQTAFAQLENDLREMILSGKLQDNTAIPTEAKLSKNYGISRNTARKALANLVAEGLLQKTQGRGTFVVPIEERKPVTLDTPTIAAIIPYFDFSKSLSTYDRNLVSGFLEYNLQHNTKIDILNFSTINSDKILKNFYKGTINGIIWERPCTEHFHIIEELRDSNVPQITISRSIPGVPSIFFDGETSIQETVNFLVSIGHRNISFIDFDLDYPIFKKRNIAFIDTLRKNKISNPENKLLLMKWKENLSFKDFEQKMGRNVNSTVIIVASCFVNIAFAWAEERGIRIPEDLTLISLSCLNAEELKVHPSISAIIEPRKEIGTKAMELCHKLINRKEVSLFPVKINGELLIRKTCSPPRYLAKILAEV
jgi:DNA-binding LacI/PurR family transcriptional regulator